jgi:hypothetical protein
MKLFRRFAASAALSLAAAISVFGQGNYKIGTASATPSDLPAAVASALNAQGTSLLDGSGAAVANIWWAKAIPGAAGGSTDAVYPDLAVSTFVGVLQLPTGGSDFRGQKIKGGTYTLRYARIPQDGNHMGVNPYPDFVLLVPAASDTDPAKTFGVTDLVKMSKLATGTNHPGVMSLVPATQGATFPSLVQDDQGHWVLEVQVSESAGGSAKQLPLALIVVGQTTTT